jgi:hypothetical protein
MTPPRALCGTACLNESVQGWASAAGIGASDSPVWSIPAYLRFHTSTGKRRHRQRRRRRQFSKVGSVGLQHAIGKSCAAGQVYSRTQAVQDTRHAKLSGT